MMNILSIKKELADFGILTDRISNIPNADISIPTLEDKIPSIPNNFVFNQGWTRYSNSGYESVEYPQEDGLIFDVEVCMKNGPLPTLATAVSKTSWYSWVSKHLIDGTSLNFMKKPLTPDVMIPLESSKNDYELNLNRSQDIKKIIVGHNVSFDRVRVKEQYWQNENSTKFLDTMSLHICISGTSSYQRTILKSKHSDTTNEQLHSISSLNNLADVYKLYCGTELIKTNRDIFINGELQDIKKHFNESMLYCALDVVATHKVLKKIFPMFLERFPHFATLAGMLELGSSYLPVNYNWKRYLEEAETTHDDLNLEKNVLEGIDMCATRILKISKMCSYWKNNRDRIMSQLVIWLDSKNMHFSAIKNNSFLNCGAIIPQVVASGTVTRRAVEATWMTASNTDRERIGSELRAMIHAPLNYCIVGADVDSQELWIASIIGDSFSKVVKIQGGTPFSWMTLIGNKSQCTDMHSVTAKAVGISRDEAKIINYARIYGAGQKFAERLLKQFNPIMSDKEAALKSKKMFLMTKGQKFYRLKKFYISEEFIDKLYTESECLKISKLHNKSRDEVFEKGKWIGGSESAMFNSLEEIAEQKEPATPFLHSRLSRALEKETNEKYLPTKINWVVQSAAVDFLHLILLSVIT
ncbi:PREDICTED: DNA polymerase subunit gamma-1, mitochondrial [Ceratosolen solmsi marchali]|uniref:DNA-directed DNA polymerase n=1 Tax=Ceratosolen solmsi marchali TaxID=326594 RepID=A0AAJ7DTH9_9HYME|nr:PREDICTED: DNA polymerase subunit gamma-1, mitochondrial [Ceratosolen solmsi marchali]